MAGSGASTIGKAYVQILPSMEGIAGQMTSMLGGAVQEAGEKAGREMGQAMGGSLSSGLLSALTGIGSKIAGVMKTAISEVTGFVSDSVKTGMGFDTAMSQVAATMGTTVDEIKDLREFAKEMGATTQYSATESAEALNYMALAGYDVKTSMEMLPNVMSLAAAGAMDLARSSDMITDTQTALGLSIADTNKLVDQMAKTASKTNTSVEQLGDAMLTIGGTAKNLKGGTAELNQVLGIMADNGIKGTEAGTHLRNIMLSMTPSSEAAAKAFEQLGLEAYDSQGNLRSMSEIFGDLSKALDGMTDEERTSILQSMFNKTDLSTVNALLDTNAERWTQVAAEIDKCDGAASAMADTQLDNLQGSLTILKSAFEGLQIAISDEVTPKLKEFVDFGAEGLSRLTKAFQGGGIEGMADEFGKLLEELAAKVSDILPTILNAFTKIAGGAVTAFTKALPSIVNAVRQAIPQIAAALGNIADALIDIFPDLTNAFVQLVGEIAALLPQVLPKIGQALMAALPSLINGLTDILPLLIETLTGIIEQIAQLIPEIIPPLFTAIVNAIPIIVQTIADNLPVIIQALTDAVLAVAEIVPDILPVLLPALTDGIKALIKGLSAAMVKLPELGAAVLDVIMAIVDAILDNQTVILDCAADVFAAVGQAIIDNFPEFMDAIGQLFVKVVDIIASWFPKMWEQGKKLWKWLIDGVKDNWDEFMRGVYKWGDSVLEAFESVWNDMKDFWGGLWDDMVEAGGDLIMGLIEGIKQKWEDLKDSVEEFGETVIETFCDFFDINSPSKVMEDMIGKNLALGIDVGFTDNIDDASKSMSKSLNSVLDDCINSVNAGGLDLSANVSGITAADAVTAAADAGEGLKAAPAVVKIVTPDGRTLAEWLLPDMNAVMGRETVLQTKSYAR